MASLLGRLASSESYAGEEKASAVLISGREDMETSFSLVIQTSLHSREMARPIVLSV